MEILMSSGVKIIKGIKTITVGDGGDITDIAAAEAYAADKLIAIPGGGTLVGSQNNALRFYFLPQEPDNPHIVPPGWDCFRKFPRGVVLDGLTEDWMILVSEMSIVDGDLVMTIDSDYWPMVTITSFFPLTYSLRTIEDLKIGELVAFISYSNAGVGTLVNPEVMFGGAVLKSIDTENYKLTWTFPNWSGYNPFYTGPTGDYPFLVLGCRVHKSVLTVPDSYNGIAFDGTGDMILQNLAIKGATSQNSVGLLVDTGARVMAAKLLLYDLSVGLSIWAVGILGCSSIIATGCNYGCQVSTGAHLDNYNSGYGNLMFCRNEYDGIWATEGGTINNNIYANANGRYGWFIRSAAMTLDSIHGDNNKKSGLVVIDNSKITLTGGTATRFRNNQEYGIFVNTKSRVYISGTAPTVTGNIKGSYRPALEAIGNSESTITTVAPETELPDVVTLTMVENVATLTAVQCWGGRVYRVPDADVDQTVNLPSVVVGMEVSIVSLIDDATPRYLYIKPATGEYIRPNALANGRARCTSGVDAIGSMITLKGISGEWATKGTSGTWAHVE